MGKIYFPGANSGKGFFSRFGGIIPPWEHSHYTYVLKGGPGVGKNTLMKKVAMSAKEKGYEVEEFRCASDPSSLDAVRVVEMGIVVLDGTAPHSIDPVLPGICDEIVNLGCFMHQSEFTTLRDVVDELFLKNKRHYKTAYSMLSAAHSLKKEALETAYGALDKQEVGELVKNAQNGKKRELFARSATPKGIVDFADSFLPKNTVFLSGILGEAMLFEAAKMLEGKRCEIFYDFVVPECPRALVFDGGALAVADGEEKWDESVAKLIERACGELSLALSIHDKIEEIYRQYVDFDQVNEKTESLLKKIFW